ncbi:uncharacterized protein [Atheta coriaria]|uniref:uncharacterized protein isoform X2 n=1 Tax=Dalotia coriaria TaxID=877792 RepID=UPI0031F35F43
MRVIAFINTPFRIYIGIGKVRACHRLIDTLSTSHDLTKDPIDNTIQELKAKLDSRDIVDNSEVEEVDNREDDAMIPETQRGVPLPPPPPLINQDGLIIPRKLHNPVLHNGERQNLHREMLFNHKIGKNVLNQKSELAKAMEKHKDSIMRKEYEHKLASQTPELVKVIQDRAKRLEEVQTPTQNEDDKGINNVFMQARAKLKTPSDLK